MKMITILLKKCSFSFLVVIVFGSIYGIYEFKLSGLVSAKWAAFIAGASFILLTGSAAYFAQKIFASVFQFYSNRFDTDSQGSAIQEFFPLFRRLVNIVIWITALIIVLSRLGINISALIATLGVTSLAIALAAQDTIANVIAGFLIMLDRPFKVGNKIKIPTGEVVEVISIGIRRSQFRAEDGAIVIVPNVDLSKSKIVNYSYGS